MSRQHAIQAALVAAVFATAVAVVAVQHQHRKAFITLQEEIERGDRLREEWSMLQLEQEAWAGHSRLERLAREELGMVLPERDAIVILKLP
ncbi:cell division protein FtsL [Halorhodospira neutriphila]|uniref:Cell division protein FtsL n=1 Tax=Halorhodospira neutriphila TaxID=168379 RepID=A0ABS1E6R4_9GAMM|nr:cell division protein FtsL [Halorhodospira neutriphila]